MAYNVRIMEKAEEDLSEIVDYISDMLKNQKAANNLLADFLKEKENLVENPYMYPLSDNQVLQNDGYHRFLFYKNFIALYLIDNEEKIQGKPKLKEQLELHPDWIDLINNAMEGKKAEEVIDADILAEANKLVNTSKEE